MSRVRAALVALALCAAALGSGGSRADTNTPVDDVGVPVWSYDGLGWAGQENGQLIVVSRQGSRHKSDPTGRIVKYRYVNGGFVADPVALIDEPDVDERSVAGGFSRTGAMIVFYSRQKIVPCTPPATCREPWYEEWDGMRASRIEGTNVVTSEIPTLGDTSYSPYGPLVVLPSGTLMQTVYGWQPAGGWRLRALFSDDDGRTWPRQVVIAQSKAIRPTESAAVLVDGTADANAKIIVVTKAEQENVQHHKRYAVMQYTSSDGGRSWSRAGEVAKSQTAPGTVIPWIANLGDGRVALSWVDRTSLTVKMTTAPWRRVFEHPGSWPWPLEIYHSRLSDPGFNWSDFGYPSIARAGASVRDTYVVFYDTHTHGSGFEPYDLPSDVDLHAIKLFR